MGVDNANSQAVQTGCCAVSGGPAGMMLGCLLARAVVEVVVLEKHAHFFRDFRGDTTHPSILELMYELGILDDFLRRPHQDYPAIGGMTQDFSVTMADFSRLPMHCKFIALMPQWDFVNFIAEKANLFPQFHLRMEAGVTEPTVENGRVTGVHANAPTGPLQVRADLVAGAHGRHSTVRNEAGLEGMELRVPIDVLRMRIRRQPSDSAQTLGRFRNGKLLVTLDRGDYWQWAYIIPKDGLETIQQKGLLAFRENTESVAPFFTEERMS